MLRGSEELRSVLSFLVEKRSPGAWYKVAEEFGLDPQLMNNYLKGHKPWLTQHAVMKLADKLGIDVELVVRFRIGETDAV